MLPEGIQRVHISIHFHTCPIHVPCVLGLVDHLWREIAGSAPGPAIPASRRRRPLAGAMIHYTPKSSKGHFYNLLFSIETNGFGLYIQYIYIEHMYLYINTYVYKCIHSSYINIYITISLLIYVYKHNMYIHIIRIYI